MISNSFLIRIDLPELEISLSVKANSSSSYVKRKIK